MRVISEMFAGGYNSVYEQAWLDGLEDFIDYCYNEYDIEISENEIINKKISRVSNRLCISLVRCMYR